MKWILIPLFFLLFNSLNAQYVYVQSAEPFYVLLTKQAKPVKSVWIKMEDYDKSVAIKTQSGAVLNRYFNDEATNPYYIIVNKKLRYRPNTDPTAADTVVQPILKPLPERNNADWQNTLRTIKSLPYEWERTEAAAKQMSIAQLSCTQITELMNCLTYDASKVEVLNKSKNNIPPACFEKLRLAISEQYRGQLKTK